MHLAMLLFFLFWKWDISLAGKIAFLMKSEIALIDVTLRPESLTHCRGE